MARKILAWPLRLGVNGRMVSYPEDSDSVIQQRLHMLITTRQGERDLVPGFGTPDPTFNSLDPAFVRAQVSEYGPDVVIRDVSAEVVSDSEQIITISWDYPSTGEFEEGTWLPLT